MFAEAKKNKNKNVFIQQKIVFIHNVEREEVSYLFYWDLEQSKKKIATKSFLINRKNRYRIKGWIL